MNINIFGFRVDHKSLPKAVGAGMFLENMESKSGVPLDKKSLLTTSASPVGFDGHKWWGGILVRYRDAKSFNEVQTKNGKRKLKAHQIGAGQMAELGYYIAHPETGNGLFACYYTGPGVGTFRMCAKKCFRDGVRTALEDQVEAAGDDENKVAELYDAHMGELVLDNLMPMGSLKKALKFLERISTVKVNYATVEEKGGMFTKLRHDAVRRTETLTMPTDFAMNDTLAEDLAKECAAAVAKGEIVEASFVGKNKQGKEQSVSSVEDKNKVLFGWEDYDNLMGKLEIDLSDWPTSIQNSPVINWLLKHTSKADVLAALCTSA